MIDSNLFCARAQRGFTLIELMIAVTIGLALTIVVASLFLHSRSTYGSTDEVSRMQENIRYTQQLLSRIVHHAGYTSAPNVYKTIDDAPANSGAVVIFGAANPAFDAIDGGLDGFGKALPDSFTVRFQGTGNGVGTPDGAVSDCQGREIDLGVTSVNIFTIQTGANGAPALFCSIGVGIPAVEVVPDVENMQLIFGEDTVNAIDGGTSGDGSAERYLPRPAVGNINRIVSMRAALLFRTANVAATVVTEPNRTYDLNGNPIGPFNDKRIRRVVTMTLNLRNRSR